MKLIDFVVCDDIRHEIRNKVSLMGLYGDSITLEAPSAQGLKWPLAFRLGVFIRIGLENEREVPAEGLGFRLTLVHREQKTFEATGNLGLKKGDPTTVISLPIVAPAVPLLGAGKLAFSLHVMRGSEEVLTATHEIALKVREIGAGPMN